MPLDPSIALQVRSFNPLQAYMQADQLRSSDNRNALEQYTLAKAKRDDEERNALNSAYSGNVNPDGTINRSGLLSNLSKGPAAGMIPKVQKDMFEMDKAIAAMDKDKMAVLKDALSIGGGALATIAQNPTRQNAVAVVQQLVNRGLPGADKMLADIPQNEADIPMWVKLHAGSTEHGLKTIEAHMPKVSMTDMGGQIQPMNTNPMGGALGPMGAPMAKSESPDSIANRQVTMRGQNMTDARAREQMQFQQGKERQAPAGYRWAGDQLEPIPGGPASKDKALTEAQGKATGFSIRARESADLLNEMERAGTFGRVASKVQAARESVDRVPVVGTALANVVEGAGNSMVSGSQQKYDQAKRDFINAVLRVESGATITVPEFLNADRQYFPQAGDSQTVIEQKRKNRETAIKALMSQTGEGEKKVPQSRTIDAGGGWTIKRVD